MDTKLILLAIAATALGSCSTMYKSGQTPDDVYFSPTRETYVTQTSRSNDRPSDDRYYSSSDDRNIRLGINDRRWRYFDNDYYYNPYHFGFNTGYYYNPYFWPYPVYNNSFGPIYVQPSNPKITTPRVANLGGYSNNYYNSNLSGTKSGIRPPVRTYNNTNRGSAVGNAMRQVFTPSNNQTYNPGNNRSSSNNNNNNNNTRTYQPSTNSSSSSGSSSSGSSSGGGGVSRPPRGGN